MSFNELEKKRFYKKILEYPIFEKKIQIPVREFLIFAHLCTCLYLFIKFLRAFIRFKIFADMRLNEKTSAFLNEIIIGYAILL